MPPVSWRTFAKVHRDVKYRSGHDSYQFALSKGWFLEMETAQRSFPRRNRLIVLHKWHVCNFFAKLTVTPGFRKIPSRVGEPLWNNQFQIRDFKFMNIH